MSLSACRLAPHVFSRACEGRGVKKDLNDFGVMGAFRLGFNVAEIVDSVVKSVVACCVDVHRGAAISDSKQVFRR